MSYKAIKAFGSTQGLTKRIFICDSVDDVESLPTNKKMGTKQDGDTVSDELCAIGSRAEVTDTGDVYVLSANSEWIFDGNPCLSNISKLGEYADQEFEGPVPPFFE